MTLEPVSEVLRRRQQEVAARPPAPDPLEERLRIDADRHAQLAARKPTPSPAPAPSEPEAEEFLVSKKIGGADPRTGWKVIRAGAWYKLIRPDGEQHGKSQRSEEDAWALLEDQG